MDEELNSLLVDLKEGRLSRRDFVQKALAAGMTASALGLLLQSVAPAQAASERLVPAARRGGTLRAGDAGPSTGLDPAVLQDSSTIAITHDIYNFVVRIDPHFIPYPDLAKSWTSNADGTVWTFPLRSGVKFHSGKSFDADDVIYSINRIAKLGLGGSSNLSGIANIEKVDDLTVAFHLKASDPDFPLVLSDYHMCILENGWAEKNPASAFSTHPSGTGPFMLKEFVPADHALIVRNPNYFEAGLPYLDAIRFLFLPDISTRINAIKSGTIDFILQSTPAEVDPLVGASGINLVTLSGTGFLNMRMRSDRPPFNNPLLRQAFKYTVDRKALNAQVWRGRSVLGNDQPIAPAYGRWFTDIGLRARDIPKAKALLAQAGYPKGLDVKLYASPFAGQVDFAVAFQQLAADANINVTILSETWANYLAKDWLQVDFGITSWGSRPTPTQILNLLYKTGGAWNEGHYNNPQLDAAIDAANSELDVAKRKALYLKVEQIISNEGPSIIPFYSTFVFPMRTRVHGFNPSPDTFHYFKTAWLSS